MLKRQVSIYLAALFSLGLGLVSRAHAEADYPKSPITIVVPYGAGGNADLAARALSSVAQDLKALNGQSLIVVNRAGAGGLAGSESVVHARNDGYTLLLARVGSHAVEPALDPATPYKWDSFTFLGLMQTDPYVCVVKKGSPYDTFKKLIEAIKEKPGKLSFATTGNMDASVAFPVTAFLKSGLKADAAKKIPYKGAMDTTSAVLGGYVDFTCNALAPYMGGLQSGDIKALVVSTPERVSALPNVPTVGELGLKDLEAVSGWNALYGPPNLPPAVVNTWVSALQQLKGDKGWREKVERLGSVPHILPPEETRKFAKEQYDFYRGLSPYLGIGK